MWRVHGFVGRVLQRCYGNTQLRLPQNHHVEDEVINTSAALSTSRHGSDSSSQREEDGERRRKQKTFDFGQAELPRYTAIDAVSWGAAAVLFMHICRRIHSQFASGTEPSPTPRAVTHSTLHKCGYRILLEILPKTDVLPGGRSVFCLQGAPEGPKRDELQSQSSINSSISSTSDTSSSCSTDDATKPNPLTSDPERPLLIQDSSIPDELYLSASCPLQNDSNQVKAETADVAEQNTLSNEEKLAGAALNLEQVGDTSVPVILNIIGLENAKRGNYEEAFICFKAASEQGYSKAQFNVGVCYEKGRGVHKDREKALHHYWQAAAGGHRQAQYRHAKLILSSRGQQSAEELNTAISFLEQSATAGLIEAQICLASIYSQEPVRDESKSIHYLKMAADSGDDRALLFLGQCYESGFGVRRNRRRATEYYKQAARAGNEQARSLVMPPHAANPQEAVLRSISSAPCFSAACHLQQPLSSHLSPSTFTLPLLPHSWSTGSLCLSPSLSSSLLPVRSLNAEGGTCQWTVGLG
ncbi:death ligand signal enhancer [Takifugu rubripes]|uniref:Death ligand signal enhancer n=1 Tax=Takifugu rubripes TaxID=31033 RepID=A0A3B5K228_TAKRU|nr:death ligand signal enhancer [Takifugu rubripes]